jgi:hypothetical protein
VNYKGFNKIIVKNRHSLFLVEKILDRFSGAAVYIKFNFKNVYYRIRIRKKDEWKTIFRIRYNNLEYKIMLFDFVNVPAIFQAYINKALVNFININYVAYLNNILIYSFIYVEY